MPLSPLFGINYLYREYNITHSEQIYNFNCKANDIFIYKNNTMIKMKGEGKRQNILFSHSNDKNERRIIQNKRFVIK